MDEKEHGPRPSEDFNTRKQADALRPVPDGAPDKSHELSELLDDDASERESILTDSRAEIRRLTDEIVDLPEHLTYAPELEERLGLDPYVLDSVIPSLPNRPLSELQQQAVLLGLALADGMKEHDFYDVGVVHGRSNEIVGSALYNVEQFLGNTAPPKDWLPEAAAATSRWDSNIGALLVYLQDHDILIPEEPFDASQLPETLDYKPSIAGDMMISTAVAAIREDAERGYETDSPENRALKRFIVNLSTALSHRADNRTDHGRQSWENELRKMASAEG